jgi:NADPH:quinone reductase-like Zn-dependent oxidoreductase
MGGFAEYVCVPQSALARMPAGLSYEQAAALPQAGAIALQGIHDNAGVRPGRQVLVNGAGGGSGMYAIQLAKLGGAEVTGVDTVQHSPAVARWRLEDAICMWAGRWARSCRSCCSGRCSEHPSPPL